MSDEAHVVILQGSRYRAAGRRRGCTRVCVGAVKSSECGAKLPPPMMHGRDHDHGADDCEQQSREFRIVHAVSIAGITS
jgi:hypothetical protein